MKIYLVINIYNLKCYHEKFLEDKKLLNIDEIQEEYKVNWIEKERDQEKKFFIYWKEYDKSIWKSRENLIYMKDIFKKWKKRKNNQSDNQDD